jgi:hypothetical protein
MTIGKRTLNRYYAKTDNAALYRIAMGTFLYLQAKPVYLTILSSQSVI